MIYLNNFKDLGTCDKIILKWVLKKYVLKTRNSLKRRKIQYYGAFC
jgi:hypothetical protein